MAYTLVKRNVHRVGLFFIGESVVRSFDRSLSSLLAYSSLCSVFRFFVEQSFVCSFIRLFMLSVLKNFRYPTLPSP